MSDLKQFMVETVRIIEIRHTLLVTAESSERAEELVESTDFYAWADPFHTEDVDCDEATDDEAVRSLRWTGDPRGSRWTVQSVEEVPADFEEPEEWNVCYG